MNILNSLTKNNKQKLKYNKDKINYTFTGININIFNSYTLVHFIFLWKRCPLKTSL